MRTLLRNISTMQFIDRYVPVRNVGRCVGHPPFNSNSYLYIFFFALILVCTICHTMPIPQFSVRMPESRWAREWETEGREREIFNYDVLIENHKLEWIIKIVWLHLQIHFIIIIIITLSAVNWHACRSVDSTNRPAKHTVGICVQNLWSDARTILGPKYFNSFNGSECLNVAFSLKKILRRNNYGDRHTWIDFGYSNWSVHNKYQLW